MTIKQALIWGAKKLGKSKSSAIDAEVLLLYSFNQQNKKSTKQEINKTQILITKSFFYSNPDFEISSKTEKIYKKLIFRRKKGEPIAYITKHKEFFGLGFYIDKSVLIPRPESELLVEKGIKRINKYLIRNTKYKILDIGTGSGAIIISLAKTLKAKSYPPASPEAKLWRAGNLKPIYYASDISATALKIAKINAKKHKVLSDINFIKSNLFYQFEKKYSGCFKRSFKTLGIKFDLIIANLPYLDPKWIGKELRYEPQTALNGGKNGLCIIEKFLSEANNYLSSKGSIFIEIDPRQKEKIKKLTETYFSNKTIRLKNDLSGKSRVLIIS